MHNVIKCTGTLSPIGPNECGELPRMTLHGKCITTTTHPAFLAIKFDYQPNFAEHALKMCWRRPCLETSNPSFCPLRMSSPIPLALSNPGLVEVVHRASDHDSRIVPRTVCWRRRLEGCVPDAFRIGGLPPDRGFGFAPATSISSRTTVTPYSTYRSHRARALIPKPKTMMCLETMASKMWGGHRRTLGTNYISSVRTLFDWRCRKRDSEPA